jgi:hypothetical protein
MRLLPQPRDSVRGRLTKGEQYKALRPGFFHQLVLLDHVHELNADECDLGCCKRLEPEHGAQRVHSDL